MCESFCTFRSGIIAIAYEKGIDLAIAAVITETFAKVQRDIIGVIGGHIEKHKIWMKVLEY